MYVKFHAAIAGAFAANEVAVMGDIEFHHISSSSGGVIVNRVFGVAGLIVGLVHFKYVVLVPVVHENCQKRNYNYDKKNKKG